VELEPGRARGPVARVASLLAIAMSVYHVWVVATGTPEAILLRGTHLLFALVLIFLLMPAGGRAGRLVDLGLVLASVASIGYLFVSYEYVTTRIYYADPVAPADMVFGWLLVLLVLEAARRTTGWVLPITALVFLVYPFAGPYLPGLFNTPTFSPGIVLDQLYLTTEGIFGIPLAVSATYVIVFVIFGSFLAVSGVGQFFTDFATALTGGSRGGPG
jgi:TRAP-type uncharacterized transport system fused permease subunit